VQQRLHEDDLTGHVLSENGKQYKHYCFPAERCDGVKPARYRSRYFGGLLHGALFDRAFLNEAKRTQGSYTYSGQFMQRPAPEGGGMFRRAYWCFWKPRDLQLPAVQTTTPDGLHTHTLVDLPERFDTVYDSWDCAFRGTKGSDRVAGQKWARKGPDKFLLDQTLGNLDFIKTKTAIVALRAKQPKPSGVLIEARANGDAVIAELKRTTSGIIPVEPVGSKTHRAVDASRAMSVVAQCEAGNLYLPHPHLAKWVDKFIEEFANFPLGKHDDQVDACTQAIRKLSAPLPLLYTSAQYERDSKAQEKAA
jgi:predicted phage terminase large subunit-like protein